MEAYVTSVDEKAVEILMRAEGDDGILGDRLVVVGPGEKFAGFTFLQLIKHGPGALTLPEKVE